MDKVCKQLKISRMFIYKVREPRVVVAKNMAEFAAAASSGHCKTKAAAVRAAKTKKNMALARKAWGRAQFEKEKRVQGEVARKIVAWKGQQTKKARLGRIEHFVKTDPRKLAWQAEEDHRRALLK